MALDFGVALVAGLALAILAAGALALAVLPAGFLAASLERDPAVPLVGVMAFTAPPPFFADWDWPLGIVPGLPRVSPPSPCTHAHQRTPMQCQ